MFTAILQQTPHRVWGLLAVLTLVGVRQTLPRRRSVRSATALPLAMMALSFYGVASVFSSQPLALVAWAFGAAALLWLSVARGAWSGIRWSEAERSLIVPGSWWPLLLLPGMFFVKFGVSVAVALNPARVSDAAFAGLVGLVYGAFCGTFLARGVAMWRVARQAALGGTAPL